MKNFLLITNKSRDKDLEFTRQVIRYITDKGGKACSIVTGKENYKTETDSRTDSYLPEQIRKGLARAVAPDCIMVFGGDGTFVRTSRDLAELKIPVIGVNLGTLGYLCELERSNVFHAIDRLFQDEYEVEHRMMLEGIKCGGSGECIRALNDIVIHRKEPTQLINLRISVNGEFLTSYHADGIIIAAPTGSTSYSLSAGGPIVDPKADMILLTPINPHNMQSRSIVIGSDSTIEVELLPRRPEQDEQATVDFDGDSCAVLSVGDKITAHRTSEDVKILKLNKVSFLQILSKKMDSI